MISNNIGITVHIVNLARSPLAMKQLINNDCQLGQLFVNEDNDSNFGEFKSIFNLDLYGEHMPEERITGSKIDLDLSAGSTYTRVYMVVIQH